MKRIVVDSSVCVNWFTSSGGKRNRTYALELLDQVHAKHVHVTQPAIWRAHVAGLLVHKRGTNPHAVVDTLLSIESRDQNSAIVLHLGMDLATKFHADLFDTLYHALAIDKGIELITTNADYLQRAGHLGHIRLLSDWAARSRIAEGDGRHPHRRRAATPHLRQKKH